MLWVEGEGENLVAAHDKFFNDALWQLQKDVECYRFNNVNVWPQCASYFDCGLTVLPAPRGKILKVYTIGKPKSASSSSSSASSSASNVIVGTASFNQSIFNPAQADLQVVNVVDAATYEIKINQQYNFTGLGTADSPQYLRTTISYVDPTGATQVIQPSADAHLDGLAVEGFLQVQIKAGTDVKCTLTPANTPFTDGDFTVDVTVTKIESSNVSGFSGDSSTDFDWCLKVFYEQVDYCYIEKYHRIARHCSTSVSIVSQALAFNLFGCGWRNKHRYPCPTDAGFESLPKLPQGFHYPQTSTDAGGRSRGGVWAIYRGRIYIAPWIESDEAAVIEWNGIKNQFADSDLVEEDPKFAEAVRFYVNIKHYTNYEQDPQKLQELKDQFYGIRGRPGILQDLIHECREQIRIHSCAEVGGNGAGARGIGAGDTASALFYNEVQSFTASCPVGQTGTPVTSNISAGQVGSSLSVADANARALAQAQADAESRLSCAVASTTFLNTPQTFTASCPRASGDTPAATGSSVTITTPAGQFSSTVSQEAADAAAMAAATSSANNQLVCTFYNSPKSYTASCPSGSTGSDSTADIPAGVYSSISQADADAKAQAAAQAQAVAGLVCVGIAVLTIGNTVQTYQVSGNLSCPPLVIIKPGFPTRIINAVANPQPYFIHATVPENTFTAVVTAATQAAKQLELNQQAQSAAQQSVQNYIAAASGGGGGGNGAITYIDSATGSPICKYPPHT